jgi:hypothetical protein
MELVAFCHATNLKLNTVIFLRGGQSWSRHQFNFSLFGTILGGAFRRMYLVLAEKYETKNYDKRKIY